MGQSAQERQALREALMRYIDPNHRSMLLQDAGLEQGQLNMHTTLEEWLFDVDRWLTAQGPAARKGFLAQCSRRYPALEAEPAFQKAWAEVKDVPVPSDPDEPRRFATPPLKRNGLWLVLTAVILCALAWGYASGWMAPLRAELQPDGTWRLNQTLAGAGPWLAVAPSGQAVGRVRLQAEGLRPLVVVDIPDPARRDSGRFVLKPHPPGTTPPRALARVGEITRIEGEQLVLSMGLLHGVVLGAVYHSGEALFGVVTSVSERTATLRACGRWTSGARAERMEDPAAMVETLLERGHQMARRGKLIELERLCQRLSCLKPNDPGVMALQQEQRSLEQARGEAEKLGRRTDGRASMAGAAEGRDATVDRRSRPSDTAQPGLLVRPKPPRSGTDGEDTMKKTKKGTSPTTHHIEINIGSHNTAEAGSRQTITGIEGGQVPIQIGPAQEQQPSSTEQP